MMIMMTIRTATSFGVPRKGPRFQQSKSQWAYFGKTANATTTPRACRGRRTSRWHRCHSLGHLFRRPRQQHSHGNRSCSQPCRHPLDYQTQSTIRNSRRRPSGHWNSRYLAPPGSWAGPGTWKAGDHNHRRLQIDHLPVPAVISVALQKGNAVSFQNTFTAG